VPQIPPVLARVRAALDGAGQSELVLSRNGQALLARHGRFVETPKLQEGALA
jgi:hypothetical protein